MFVEVDTDIAGIVELLAAEARINLRDARRYPRLADEIVKRCTAAPGEGWIYVRDPKGRDWSTFRPLFQRYGSKPIKADCEDQAGGYGAAMVLMLPPEEVIEVAVTQPHPDSSVAHAYLCRNRHLFARFIDSVFDPSVYNGMARPDPSFYGSGETAFQRITRIGD